MQKYFNLDYSKPMHFIYKFVIFDGVKPKTFTPNYNRFVDPLLCFRAENAVVIDD